MFLLDAARRIPLDGSQTDQVDSTKRKIQQQQPKLDIDEIDSTVLKSRSATTTISALVKTRREKQGSGALLVKSNERRFLAEIL